MDANNAPRFVATFTPVLDFGGTGSLELGADGTDGVLGRWGTGVGRSSLEAVDALTLGADLGTKSCDLAFKKTKNEKQKTDAPRMLFYLNLIFKKCFLCISPKYFYGFLHFPQIRIMDIWISPNIR